MPGFRAGSARTRALLGVLAIVSLVAVFTTRVSRKMPDFEVYRTAGARALAAEPLYRADDGHFQFKYLPAFAIFAAPLAMVPLAGREGRLVRGLRGPDAGPARLSLAGDAGDPRCRRSSSSSSRSSRWRSSTRTSWCSGR